MAYLEDVKAQPTVIPDLVARLEGSDAVRQAASRIADSRGVWLTGMGSSHAASVYGSYVLAGPGRWAVPLDAGEALHYADAGSLGDAPVIAISQSGGSFETVRLAERLRGRMPLIAITNVANSPLTALADVVIRLDVPPDGAISIKTYTASLATLALLATRTTRIPSLAPEDLRAALEAVVLAGPDRARKVAPAMAGRAISVVGRGPAYSSALFGALLFKEAAHRPAEALTGGQFRHGPVELAGPAHAAVVLAPNGPTGELQRRLARDLAAHGSSVVLVGPPPEPAPATDLNFCPIPALPQLWSPLAEACALQWLAWACGLEAGHDVGRLDRTARVVDYE